MPLTSQRQPRLAPRGLRPVACCVLCVARGAVGCGIGGAPGWCAGAGDVTWEPAVPDRATAVPPGDCVWTFAPWTTAAGCASAHTGSRWVPCAPTASAAPTKVPTTLQ
eukprot:gene35880-4275_t